MQFFKDLSVSAVSAGFVAVLVGFTSSVAIVFQAAQSFHATPGEIASWMWALGLGMGLCSLVPSLWLRKPVMVAWSTPGAAVLAAAGTTGQFETDEGSVFGNASYDLPGTYFGGKVRISGLLGFDGLTQDNDARTFKNEIDAFIYGGSYLWSKGNFYSMSLIIGLSGEADGQDAAGKYNYDISGYYTNTVYGYTWDMAGGWKFDARVNIGSYDIDGDSFTIPTTATTINGHAEGWNAGIKGTVFTIIEMGGGVARPYLAAAYKNVFDEDIEVRGAFTADFDQDDNYGLLEAGYDFVQGPWTYGAAIYTEFSGDQDTVGGRVGVSLKLQ